MKKIQTTKQVNLGGPTKEEIDQGEKVFSA